MNYRGNSPVEPYSPQIGAAVVASLAILSWTVVAGVVRLCMG